MLGEMLKARAAAEKPPLSTTFTKVLMLVMRSMRSSPDFPDRTRDMLPPWCPFKWSPITFAHVSGKGGCHRQVSHAGGNFSLSARSISSFFLYGSLHQLVL